MTTGGDDRQPWRQDARRAGKAAAANDFTEVLNAPMQMWTRWRIPRWATLAGR